MNGLRRRFFVFAAIGSVFALSLALLSAGGVQAQGEEGGHPAHIHSGSCDELGDVLYPLSNVGPGLVLDGEAQEDGEAVGSDDDIYPVDISYTTVSAPLAEIANGDTAINVHESTDEIQNYIACGNIGGTMIVGDSLVVGLETLNDSGYSGIAVLTSGGDFTVVTVYISEGLDGDDHGGDDDGDDHGGDDDRDDRGGDKNADQGDSGAGQGDTATVDIADFAFGPATIEIAAGTEVTWTNSDSSSHTVTADDGSFDSGKIDGGGTFSFTFTTPGTYAYHCDFHPNMTATIVVT